MDELFTKIKKIIAEKLEVEEDKITLEASFRQDLGADSLDTYELVYHRGRTRHHHPRREGERVRDSEGRLRVHQVPGEVSLDVAAGAD